MTTTSALPTVLDALVTRFTTDAPAGVVVFDGPSVQLSSAMESVSVGADDLMPQDVHAGTEAQEWAALGALAKRATGSINCMVVAQSGTTDIHERRDRAFVILAALETGLRSNVDLGGTCLFTGMTFIDLRQQQTAEGSVVRITFTVTYTARLGI